VLSFSGKCRRPGSTQPWNNRQQTAQQRQWHGEMLELDRRSTSHPTLLGSPGAGGDWLDDWTPIVLVKHRQLALAR